MNKENEDPIEDPDIIDRAILKIETLALKHGKQLCIFAPPAVGFSIFLAYFIKQGFYPSFDILQFTSLLISAFLAGGLLIVSLTILMSIPGFLFREFFKKDSTAMLAIKNSIKPSSEEDFKGKAFSAFRNLLAIPIIIGAIVNFIFLTAFTGDFVKSFFILPFVLSLIFCAIANFLYGLQTRSIAAYFFILGFSVMASNFSIISAVDISSDMINQIEVKEFQYALIFIASIAVAMLVAISCIGSLIGVKYIIYANLAFASAIMLYSGALTNFPDKFIRTLGLGNYKATSIVLAESFCNPAIFKIEINNNCEIRDAFVIWSLGDYTLLRLESKGGGTYKFQIHNQYIKAFVIKNSKNNDVTKNK